MPKKLINDPDNLIDELIEGMVSAHPHLIMRAGDTGRTIAAVNGPRDGKVGIVVGGGSGHEPAFAGYVGRGLADASPLGNIFASPAPSQIVDAAYAADGGAGILFLYGNYTGDVMNFNMAAEELVAEGIDARSFVTTDDVASAPRERAHERRGIAGNFFVFKVAGAAADLGLPLDDVATAAERANAATLTMGVALSACTLPHTTEPNFTIDVGDMEVGMGIHGEPGVERTKAGTADEVTRRLMDPILAELGLNRGDEVAVLVNGLGSTTLLELYLLQRGVARRLDELGVTIHHSWVGEYCTSLEMAGASITLMKLDPQLRAWLDHPCTTPALSVGAVDKTATGAQAQRTPRQRAAGPKRQDQSNLKTDGPITPAVFRTMLQSAADAIFAERDNLSALDGALGDGDHGITMEVGWKAVLAVTADLPEDETITHICHRVSSAFLDAVGATAGPLYASAFETAGTAVADRRNLDAAALIAWIDGMASGIVKRGGAEAGDKTMTDAWLPAAAAAQAALAAGGDAAACLAAAATAARAGATATKDMESRRGRSKKLGQRSIGHIDPGAASAAVMIEAFAAALSRALN